MSTGIGFFLIIILPISAIFITEIIDLIKKLKKNDEEEKKQKYLDELKEQIKKELSKENE
jgi:predicted PurR-regulated permease PerM